MKDTHAEQLIDAALPAGTHSPEEIAAFLDNLPVCYDKDERARIAYIAGMKMQMLEESPELAAMMTDKEYEAIREAFEVTAAAHLPADERFLP